MSDAQNHTIEHAVSLAENALANAEDARSTAQQANTTAQDALSAAGQAQTTAAIVTQGVDGTRDIAEKARDRAEEAYNKAEEALQTAQNIAEAVAGTLEAARSSSHLYTYTPDVIDADGYYAEPEMLYVASSASSGFPDRAAFPLYFNASTDTASRSALQVAVDNVGIVYTRMGEVDMHTLGGQSSAPLFLKLDGAQASPLDNISVSVSQAGDVPALSSAQGLYTPGSVNRQFVLGTFAYNGGSFENCEVVSESGVTLVRVTEGAAVIIRDEFSVQNALFTVLSASCSSGSLTLTLRCQWLLLDRANSSVTWNEWLSGFTPEQATKLAGIEDGAQVNTVTSVAGKTGDVILSMEDVGIDSLVSSVNGRTGDVTLEKDDVGLGNVDDTADMDKPVSTAMQAAIDSAINGIEVGWNDLTDKPESFAPSAHQHDAGDISSGVLPQEFGGTGRTDGKAVALATARTVRTNLASTAAAGFDGTGNIDAGVTGTLPMTNGGTGRTDGRAPALVTARAVCTNLGSTAWASFDGTANIMPGVTGTLPAANGGTGRTDGKAVALATARQISLTGAVSGSATFDGSSAVSIATSVSASGFPRPKASSGVGQWRVFQGGALPSGGTWAYFAAGVPQSSDSFKCYAGVAAGGTGIGGLSHHQHGFAWRIA